MTGRQGRSSLTLALLLCLAACVPLPREAPPAVPERPAGFPAERYQPARPGQVYRIEPGRSRLLVYVYREGALGRLGHNHLISSEALRGYARLAEPLAGSTFDLYLPLESLVVDDPALRAVAGEEFASVPSAEDKAGTRGNMLGEETLDATRFPFAVISGRVVGGELPEPQLEISITLHGLSRSYHRPVQIERGPAELRARGELAILQSDFGITPYSVLGGALRVRDEVRLEYDLLAVPLS